MEMKEEKWKKLIWFLCAIVWAFVAHKRELKVFSVCMWGLKIILLYRKIQLTKHIQPYKTMSKITISQLVRTIYPMQQSSINNLHSHGIHYYNTWTLFFFFFSKVLRRDIIIIFLWTDIFYWRKSNESSLFTNNYIIPRNQRKALYCFS